MISFHQPLDEMLIRWVGSSVRRLVTRIFSIAPKRLLVVPPPRLSLREQSERTSGIIREYGERARIACDLHESAALKVDAAEYSFSSMLSELNEVMRTPASDWTPMRQAPRTKPAARSQLTRGKALAA